MSAHMKAFHERQLPLVTPYVIINDQGEMAHPLRYPEKGNQKWVLISNAGLPETKHFDVLLENYREDGTGMGITVNEDHSLKMTLNDGRVESSWSSDPVLKAGELHHVGIVIDGGPKTISYILDGKFLDGGDYRQYGWGRYHPYLLNVKGRRQTLLAPGFDGEIETVRIYDRALRSSELVGNFRAGHQ
jgi:hypothetical protein